QRLHRGFPVRLRDRQHVIALPGLGPRTPDHASSAAEAYAAAVDARCKADGFRPAPRPVYLEIKPSERAMHRILGEQTQEPRQNGCFGAAMTACLRTKATVQKRPGAPGYTGLGFSDPRKLALTPSASTDSQPAPQPHDIILM